MAGRAGKNTAKRREGLEQAIHLLRSGDGPAAEAALARYLKRAPGDHEARALLAGTRLAMGRISEALSDYGAVVAATGADTEDRRQAARRIGHVLSAYALPDDRPVLDRRTLLAVLNFEEIDPQPVVMAALLTLKSTPPWRRAFEQLEKAGPDGVATRLLSREGRASLADPLAIAILERGINTDPGFEQLLTALRRSLLDNAFPPHAVGFARSLAQQCWLDEFAFAESEAEKTSVESLIALAASGDAGDDDLIRLALYRPLVDFGWAADLDPAERPDLADLIATTVTEPLAEQEIAGAIPAVTEIEATAEPVRRQYEENPYPRWTHASRAVDGARLEPLRVVAPSVACDQPLRVLIAGCGTGRQAIGAATGYGHDARVLAVDLSRASLAYAKRKAEEFGLDNLDFRHGDIMELARLDKQLDKQLDAQFDVIECIGVLHHMADPVAGWRCLVERLAPGGALLIGLYREAGRRHVAAARAEIEAMGLSPTADGIRAYRAHVLASDGDPSHMILRGLRDFHSLSGCRDLVFHARERNYTLDDVGNAIDELGLVFRGFQLPELVLRRFREAHPRTGAEYDLADWVKFEAANPDAFDALYRFWCVAST